MGVQTPFWFDQRQGKAEPAGADMLRLTAPNMKEAFIGIRRGDNGLYAGFLRANADGADVATTPFELARPEDAWWAAFELYRTHLVT